MKKREDGSCFSRCSPPVLWRRKMLLEVKSLDIFVHLSALRPGYEGYVLEVSGAVLLLFDPCEVRRTDQKLSENGREAVCCLVASGLLSTFIFYLSNLFQTVSDVLRKYKRPLLDAALIIAVVSPQVPFKATVPLCLACVVCHNRRVPDARFPTGGAEMTDHVGQHVGNYRLLRLLGRGGFADVYLGEHIHLQSLAALKLLHTRLSEGETARFLTEARTLARLSHPHIMRVLDFALHEGFPFLVMEYASGGSLRQRHPAGSRLPLTTVVSYVNQVASALQYAHDQRLIHRDVKPENMLLGARDEVLLADFGLVVLATQSSTGSTRAMEPSLAGTTPYLAPEQLQGQPRPASDQYALGVVVYEWLCGSRPFSGPPIQIAMQQLSTPPASLREQVPDLSPAVEEVVLRALAKEPVQRFSRVQDFASALQHAAASVIPSAFAAEGSPSVHITFGSPDAPAQAATAPTPGAVAAQQVGHEEQETPVDTPLPTPLWKVPTVLTPLVGRERDVATVCVLLARPEVRLLTLLGAGGIGKTRLAIEVATQLRERFADGVCFVALAPIRDPSLLLSSIAHELGLQEGGAQPLVETVKVFLRDKHVLLLLDNFEQLVSAAPLLEELLMECPRLAIVVTSREVLRLQAEHLFPVPSLALPDLAQLPEREELAGYASVALFLQRAQAIKPDFQLTPANGRAIAEICMRLDGLPLALELAAARIRVLPPQALLSRLSQRFQVLTEGPRTKPERQQTLRNTLQWSFDLLDAQEQRLFRRLSVFIGGWTLQAVEAVCYQAPKEASSALDEVTSLLDKSLLLHVEPAGGEARLQMLMTVREYALECLQASGEAETIQRAHAAYYLAWVQEVEPHLKGVQQLEWLAQLEQEIANVFAALETAFEQGLHAELVRGVKAFTRFLEIRGAYAQAEIHLKRAEQAARSLQDLPGLTMTLCYLGEVADKQGNYAQAESYLQEGLALARQSGDRAWISDLLHSLSTVLRRRGDYDLGESYLQEGLALARQVGDRERICRTLRSLGSVESEKGNYPQAEAYLQEGLALARQVGDREQICVLLVNLGYVSMKTGKNTQGEGYTQEALALARQIGYREAEVVLLGNLAELIGKRGDYAQAETYFRDALALARQIGDRERIGIHLGNLGWVAGEQGNDAQAEAYIQEGVALARQINYHWLLSALLNEQGELHLKQQRYEAAGRDFREMRDIASEGDPEYLGLACYGLARIEASQGNLSEAPRLGQESLAILEKIGHFKAPEVKQWLNTLPEPSASSKRARAKPAGLTAREMEVLRLVAQGLTDAQVAEQLVISPRTVNFHLTSIYSKLQVSSRSAATRYAIEQHLV